jgi:hypothetical protein
LLVVGPRRREGLVLGLVSLGGALAAYGLYWLAYGEEMVRQTFFFHFIKGESAPLVLRGRWLLQGAGPLLLVGAVGLLLLARVRPRAAAALGGMLGAELLFDGVVSATFWPHYLIPALLQLVVGGAWAIERGVERLPRFRSGWAVVLAGGVLLLGALGPFREARASLAEWAGLAGVSRREARTVGAGIAAVSDEDEVIVAPPFTALLARRRKAVNFKDNWGLMLALRRAQDRGGLRALRAEIEGKDFARIRAESRRFWIREVAEGIRARIYPVIVVNYELPVDPRFLEQSGYVQEAEWNGETIWVRR